MIQFTGQEFQIIKEKGEEFYNSINEVYCPYFKEKVYFSEAGLEHIKFKGRNRARFIKDQFMRLKLIFYVPEIIGRSGTLQGIHETKRFEKIRMHNRTESILKPVTYYEFIAIIKRSRIKIVLKQIDNGQKLFWSIIPFWRTDSRSKSRLLYDEIFNEGFEDGI